MSFQNFCLSQAGAARPFMFVGLVLLIGGAMMSGNVASGEQGLTCRLTDSPEINRVLCNLHPDRLLALMN